MKMESMMAECAAMYPEDVSMHLHGEGGMEPDATKAEEMMKACEAMASAM